MDSELKWDPLPNTPEGEEDPRPASTPRAHKAHPRGPPRTTHLGLGASPNEWAQFYVDSKLQWDPFPNTSKEEEDRRPTSSPQLTTGKGDRKLRMVRHAKDEHERR